MAIVEMHLIQIATEKAVATNELIQANILTIQGMRNVQKIHHVGPNRITTTTMKTPKHSAQVTSAHQKSVDMSSTQPTLKSENLR